MAVAGRLQELPTNAPLSKEASWRAVVVWAVLPMAVADAAAGVPPRSLLAMLQGARRRSGLLARRGEWVRIRMSSGKAYPGARWLGREHVQNACSARAPGVHGDCSTKCQDGQNC